MVLTSKLSSNIPFRMIPIRCLTAIITRKVFPAVHMIQHTTLQALVPIWVNQNLLNELSCQIEDETWDIQSDCQLTASLWNTEFAIAEFEQQNKNILNELNNLKVCLRRANRSRANAETNAERTEPKIEISEKITSDLFEENKDVKQQLEEATPKAESLQSELLEANKTNILLKKKMDDYDLAHKRFQEYLTKKTNQIKDQAEVEKLVKQLQVMKVEIDIQRAEAI